MRAQNKQLPSSFKLNTGFKLITVIFIGVAIVRVALAGTDVLDATQDEPGSAPEAVATPLTGLQVYNEICVACHTPPGIGGAPALGNSDAWAPRIATGMDTLIDHALNGYSGKTGIMPRKGGRIDLSDEEIINAVEYLVEQVDQ